jgi:hypothetical protein
LIENWVARTSGLFGSFGRRYDHHEEHKYLPAQGVPHSSHWGAFSVLARDRGIEIVPHPRDLDPSALLGNIPASVSHRARVARPMIRRGWLEEGPGPDGRRGCDEFVAVSWPEAFDRVAAELRRVYDAHGPRAVFGGSYGWASAGRFHDAQHQIHRFLNLAGGYVRSVNSYSSGAASVILPHIIGPQAAVGVRPTRPPGPGSCGSPLRRSHGARPRGRARAGGNRRGR